MEENNKLIELDIKKIEFWNSALTKVEPILNYFTQKISKHDAPIAKSSIWLGALIIIVILGLSFWLVVIDKLDSSAFTFVIGTIIGYLIAITKIFHKTE